MALKAMYASGEEVPEAFRELFEERDGAFRLTKIEGIKTDADVARVSSALEKERAERKKVEERWKGFFGDRSPDDVQAALDRLPELEAAASGKMDDEKLGQLVEGRLRTKLAPVERELNAARTKLTERERMIEQFQARERQRTIHDAVRSAATKLKVLDTAQEDVLMLAERVFDVAEDGTVTVKDGVGATPGVAPDIWLSEMQSKRPHWWPPSQGGGARGGSGAGGFANNPWAAEHWNITRQGQMVREHGTEKASQMAQAAGSFLGATRPAVKK